MCAAGLERVLSEAAVARAAAAGGRVEEADLAQFC